MASAWLHPLRHNKEQRELTRRANRRAADRTAEKAQRLNEMGRYDEARFEQSCVGMWAMADPGFYPPWCYAHYYEEPNA